MKENNNFQTHIDDLMARLAKLAENDFDEAVSILRDAYVLARRIFGDESPHLEDLCNIHFRPQGIIANTGHYLNRNAWAGGVKQLGRTLKSMKYEYQLILQNPKELELPSTVTLPWLFRHLSLSVWLTLASLLFIAFAMGYSASKNNLFSRLYEDISTAINHSPHTPTQYPTAPPTAIQNKQIDKTATKADTAEKTAIKP